MLTYYCLFCSSSSQLDTDMADGEPVSINHVVPEHYMEGLINNYLCVAWIVS